VGKENWNPNWRVI